MEGKKIIEKITQIFIEAGVEKIILFGSQAYGNPTPDSDIDLIIVVPSNSTPTTHREKMDLYLQYNQYIKKFKSIKPIDLLVYTRASFQQFIKLESAFSKEIIQQGVVLYETNNQRVA